MRVVLDASSSHWLWLKWLKTRPSIKDLQALSLLPGMSKGSKMYFHAGMFIALSLANSGKGFDCQSETVYSYLCRGLSLERGSFLK